MKKSVVLLFTLFCLATIASVLPAWAIDIALQEEATVTDKYVTLGDVARITPDGPRAEELAATRISHAPEPGKKRELKTSSIKAQFRHERIGEKLHWQGRRFADRGKPFNSEETRNLFLGLNYRMTEVEAAIGRVQLKKLPRIVERRRELVAALEERIGDLESVRLGKVIEGAKSSYWFLLVRVEDSMLSVSKDEFAEAVAAEGVPVTAHYGYVMYEAPWIRDRQTYGQSGCPWTCPLYGREIKYEGSCPGAQEAIEKHMVVHLHEGYTEREIEDIANALRKVERAYLV